jgi:uncharacterized protein YqgC (DUF456 family)
MPYVWGAVLCIVNALWFVTIVAGFPGTWLMVGSTVFVAWWWRHGTGPGQPAMFSIWTLVAITAIAAAAELFEFLAGVAGSRRAGGTRWGALGALLGGLVGAIVATPLIPLPVLGSLMGACIGAAVGALMLELYSGQKFDISLRSGVGAGVGTLFGRAIKLTAGAAIWVIVAIAAFWP